MGLAAHHLHKQTYTQLDQTAICIEMVWGPSVWIAHATHMHHARCSEYQRTTSRTTAQNIGSQTKINRVYT